MVTRRPESQPASAPAPQTLRRFLPSARNVAACYMGAAAEAGVFLLLTPFMVRSLGLSGYGLWGLAVAVADVLQFLDLGLREAVMKYAAAHQAREEAREVRRLADTALSFYTLAAAAAVALTAALVWWVAPFLIEDPETLSTLRWTLLLLCLSGAMGLPLGVAGTLLEGLARFDLINLFRAGNAAVRLFLVVLALQLQLGLPGVALAELVARLLLHACRWIALYRIDPALVPRPVPHRGDRRRLLGFGFWSVMRQGIEVVASRLYEPILVTLAGLPAVGAFYAGRRLAATPAEAIVPMAMVLFPLSSEMDAAGRRSMLRRTMLTTTKVAFMAAVPLALVIGLGAGPILANWLGGRAPEAEPIVLVFSGVFLLAACCLPGESILLGLGRVRLLAALGFANAVVTIGLGIPLVMTIGPVGLALSALAAVAGVQLLVQMPLAAVLSGLELSRLVRRALLPPLLCGLPVGLVMLSLRDAVAYGGLAALGAWSAGGLVAYTVLIWRFGLDAEEKEVLAAHLKRLVLEPEQIHYGEDPP